MRTAILTIGTEILFGQIVNTNAAWLSQQLNALGLDVMYHYTVGDNPRRLEALLRLALQDCDLIFTTGGLGPTQDDLTKEVICKVMEDEMVVNRQWVEKLEANAAARGRTLTQNNYKQANIPSRARILDNDAGTAPGFALEWQGKMVVAMPGPPREMTRMFELQVKPFLQEKQDSSIYYKIIRTFGLGESLLETKLLPLIDGQTDPTIATYAKEGECSLRIASKRATLEEARQAVEGMLEQVEALIGPYIYSYDDEELAQVAGESLLESGLTFSCAESCTGGLLASALTGISGISQVFERGIVTYSNRAKVEELGVSEDTLKRHGAVSEETAAEMAAGLALKTGSDLCVSVTGIAGPGGGNAEKPVGLIYIGLWHQGQTKVIRLNTGSSSRVWNRRYAVLTMLYEIYKIAKEVPKKP